MVIRQQQPLGVMGKSIKHFLSRSSAIRTRQRGFSLVELLIVLAVLGIILYVAFPNIVQVKGDSELNLAKARAEALNLGTAAYFQALGTSAAATAWSGKTSEQRYQLIKAYLAFPQATLSNFMPSTDFTVTFDSSEPHRKKATLLGPGGADIAY